MKLKLITEEQKNILKASENGAALAQDKRGRWFLNAKPIPAAVARPLLEMGYLKKYHSLRILTEAGREIIRESQENLK